VLILRGFYNGEGPHRTVGVHVDSTLNAASLRRHDAVSLPDLTPRLENLRFTEAPTYRGTGRNKFEVEVKPSQDRILPPREFLRRNRRLPLSALLFP